MTTPDRSVWRDLYGLLLEELSAHRQNDPFGEGDFYLVDDDYGSRQQKLELTSSSSFEPALVAGIQRVLARFADWEVVVALPMDDGVERGFSITASSCIEHRGA